MASIAEQTPPKKTTTLSAESRGAGSTDPGPKSASSPYADLCARKTDMVSGKNPPGGILGLTAGQVKALQVQMAFTLSNNLYSAVDPNNNAGKYMLSTDILVSQGYIKEDWYKEFGKTGTGGVIQLPGAWTKKNGISNLTEFLMAEQLQESIMYTQLTENYNVLLRNTGIKAGDTPGTIMGMLFVAHVLGPAKAKQWRDSGVGQADDGTSAGDYYGLGKYAGDVLASPTGIK
jgi:hypothetical protein